jgi:hypothetical protein
MKYILWSAKGSQSISIPADWKVSQIDDLNGGSTPVAGGSILINSTPMLVH